MIKVQKRIISSAFVGLAVLGIAVQCSEVSAQALDKRVVQEEKVAHRRQARHEKVKKEIEVYIRKHSNKYNLVSYFDSSVISLHVNSLEDFMRLEGSLRAGNYQVHVGSVEIHLQVLN